VKVEFAPYGFLGNTSAYQICIKRSGRVCRHIEQWLNREDLTPFVSTAGIELLRISRAGKSVEVLHELGGKWLKARLAVFGPGCIQVQTILCPIEMRQGQ